MLPMARNELGAKIALQIDFELKPIKLFIVSQRTGTLLLRLIIHYTLLIVHCRPQGDTAPPPQS
jgi:hypothetical protein